MKLIGAKCISIDNINDLWWHVWRKADKNYYEKEILDKFLNNSELFNDPKKILNNMSKERRWNLYVGLLSFKDKYNII